ncbi:hypothetical protein DCAR_0727102 [Daucus carota subsp. sativus]|uniref:PB1 domain-containing protein n=1 Tax=Daucus carota subsp. sativus TaxID=79200 RepID=A0A164SQS0_DAUCS|nr:PREDICTED: uncharacterized protein LOC108194010 [Daucus carota subsp. sativus]WOH07669.1 hypothetical protein DCAR_0727102 [Daucus carota subsp. sativus]
MNPPSPTPSTTTTTPDSVNSSSRTKAATESFDDSCQLVSAKTPTKLRLMCSFNGHIIPRPHDKSLCYIGGDTRIVVVDRHSSLSELTNYLSKILLNSKKQGCFTLKYQLPSEDLDSLISVTTDEDLENMVEEYDRLSDNSAGKSSRLRLFLFPVKPESGSSIGSLLENSEEWFLNALNGTNGGELSNSDSGNCLLSLDDDFLIGNNSKGNKNQDVQSMPNSPMLDRASSFGSASSTPKALPRIKVKVADDQQHKVGIEERFAQMGVDRNVDQKLEDGGLKVEVEVVTVSSGQVVGDYLARDLSDDDYRRQIQQQQAQLMASQLYKNHDLASPHDSVSSDGSITNPLPRQKPMMYQDPNIQYTTLQSRVSVEQNTTDPRIHQMQQRYQDFGYLLPTHSDPQHHQILHQQQPQFITAGSQYIQQLPAGAVTMPSYYPVYPSQHPQRPHNPALEQQYPVYYVPARQTQAYNMPVHTDYNETTPSVTMVSPSSGQYNIVRNATAPGPYAPSSLHITTNAAVVQVPTGQPQPQYLGLSQSHQPQSIAPTLSPTTSYANKFADPTQASAYYGQSLACQMAAPYQTTTSASPEAAAQLPVDSTKLQDRTL